MAMPNYYNAYQQAPYGGYPQLQNNPQTQPVQIQQNSNFIPVPNEDFARNYPVALGVSVSFKDENAPYIYTKTMGPSQLSQPIFEKYKLIKEEDAPVKPSDAPKIDFDFEGVNNTIDDLKDEISRLWKELDTLKAKKNTKKKDGDD